MIDKNSKIFIAGHNGMVGAAIHRIFKQKGFKKLIVVSKKKLNLLDQQNVHDYLMKSSPHLVIMAAAKVGGILANERNKSKFIYENLQIQNNLIHGSYLAGIKKLIYLGSSCIYPKQSRQPIKEDYFMKGPLEKTNDAYAIAKIAGIYMCNYYSKNYNLDYKCFMPCNMYGPNDNYDLNNSHFFSALIKKVLLAKKYNKKKLKVWGTGKPYRELLYVDDFADAIYFFLNNKFNNSFINIGSGKDYTIRWYAKFICKELGMKNLTIKFDKTKPDGMKRKLLDIKVAKKLGWKPKTPLKKGLQLTVDDFLTNNKF